MLNVRHILFVLTAMSCSQTVFGAAAHSNKTLGAVPLQVITLKGIFPFDINFNVADVVDRLKLLGKGNTAGRITFKFVQTKAMVQNTLAAPRSIHRAPAPAMIIGDIGTTALSAKQKAPSTVKHIAFAVTAANLPTNS